MPQQRRPAVTPPVVFDDAAWAEDLLRASGTARRVATEARGEFEINGVLIAQLKACEPEGPEVRGYRSASRSICRRPTGHTAWCSR